MKSFATMTLVICSLAMVGCGENVNDFAELPVGTAQASIQNVGGENVIQIDLVLKSDKVCGFSNPYCFGFNEPIGWVGDVSKGQIVCPTEGYIAGGCAYPQNCNPQFVPATLIPGEWNFPDATVLPRGTNSDLYVNLVGATPGMRILVTAYRE